MAAAAAFTLDQLIEQLVQLRAQHPDYGGRPVHLLDMESDTGDNLVTHVETDCFDEKQGPVTSLMSRPSRAASSAGRATDF